MAFGAGTVVFDRVRPVRDMAAEIDELPVRRGRPAYDADRKVREGAWVAELTGMLDLRYWPPGCGCSSGPNGRTPGPRLRFADSGGYRLTAFVTNTCNGQLAHLELRHRRLDPRREGQRPEEPASQRLCAEWQLDRRSPAGHRIDRMEANARLDQHRRAGGNPNDCGCCSQ